MMRNIIAEVIHATRYPRSYPLLEREMDKILKDKTRRRNISGVKNFLKINLQTAKKVAMRRSSGSKTKTR